MPSLSTRVVIQIAGAARGTGNNTADGTTVAPAVNLANPLNLTWNSTAPQRDIVAIESCNACHSALAFHGSGARVDTDFCVVCHTNQRKYGQTPAVLGTYTKVFDDGSTEVVPSWNKEPRKFPDGNAMRDMTIMVHSIHAGERLPVRTAASYIDEVLYPQPQANCVACHTGTGKNATPQGDNWKNNPSRMACGACHNNINWATGANHPGVGGARTDDSQCKTCHSASVIATVYHIDGRPDGLGRSRRLSGEHGGQRADPGLSVRPRPGDPARFVDEPAGRRAQARVRDQLGHRCFATRRRSSTGSCSTARR